MPEQYAEQAALVLEIDYAMSEFKLQALGRIQTDPQWQSDAWILERQWPDEFGRRQRIEHANPEGESFRVQPTPLIDVSRLTDEELDQWIALMEKARPEGARPVIEGEGGLRALPE